MDVQYSTQEELEEIAQKEVLTRNAKEAIAESFAKRKGIAVEVAKERLAKRSIRPPMSLVGMTSEEFEKMPDDQWFYVNKRMLIRFYERIKDGMNVQ